MQEEMKRLVNGKVWYIVSEDAKAEMVNADDYVSAMPANLNALAKMLEVEQGSAAALPDLRAEARKRSREDLERKRRESRRRR